MESKPLAASKRRTSKKRIVSPAPAPSITVTGMRQEALENFAGSLAHVTAIARGECYVTLKERCATCGALPAPALDPGQLFKLVPRPSEITQANALLAKISIPAQNEDLVNIEDGRAMAQAVLGVYWEHSLAYGVPRELLAKWHTDAVAAACISP